MADLLAPKNKTVEVFAYDTRFAKPTTMKSVLCGLTIIKGLSRLQYLGSRGSRRAGGDARARSRGERISWSSGGVVTALGMA